MNLTLKAVLRGSEVYFAPAWEDETDTPRYEHTDEPHPKSLHRIRREERRKQRLRRKR